MQKILKSKRNVTIIILILTCTIGTAWQKIIQINESKRYTSVGVYVDTGAYSAHCYIKGEGDKVLLFITGSGTPSAYTDFYYLQDALSQYGQTISFDHAGYGWSSKTKAKRDVDNLAEELSVIINSLVPENKTIILVCHSLGSLEAIHFTQKFKEKVAGIVFLDGGSPESYKTYSEISSLALNRTSSSLRVLGINRLLGNFDVLLPLYGENIRNKKLPKEIKEIDKAMYYRYTGSGINLNNIKYINENANRVLENGSIGTIPILVLSSDSGEEWKKVQEQLASWSTNSLHITLKNSEHYIHWSNSDEVISYIKEFTEEIAK